MKILVLGGAGYIGSHTALELGKAGNEVIVADNLSTGYRKAVPEKAGFNEGNLYDFDFLDNLLAKEKPDAVIHFAAFLFDTRLMGIITPMPREVNAHFTELYKSSPSAETDWYYEFSKRLNYIRAERMKKDLRWKYSCNYGNLDVTINRSKPEKDPRDIAAARTAKFSAYPKLYALFRKHGTCGECEPPRAAKSASNFG